MNSLFALLGGFTLVLCITTLLNHRYNFFDNVLGVITFGVQLILFFSYYHMTEKKEFSFTIRLTAVISSILWSICCAISLAQYLLDIQYRTLNPIGNIVRQGIVDGRLFGIFSDPKLCRFYILFSVDAAFIHFLLPKKPNSPYLYRNQCRAQYCVYRIFKFTDCIFMRDRHRIFLCITAYLPPLYRRRKNVGQTFSSLCSTKPCAFFGWNDCCLFSALLSDAEYRQTDGAAAQRNRPCPR